MKQITRFEPLTRTDSATSILQEEARWQYAESIGLVTRLAERNLDFIIVDLRVWFRIPIFEGEQIKVTNCLKTLGSTSGEVEQLVYKHGGSKVA
jgi:acyl-CoA thioesterase FadM